MALETKTANVSRPQSANSKTVLEEVPDFGGPVEVCLVVEENTSGVFMFLGQWCV